VYHSEVTKSNPFRLGLDLSGGSYLIYRADTSAIADEGIDESMSALRDVIERRINTFGVSEPSISTERHSLGVDGVEHRLVVELPGVTDVQEATDMIGQTPLLEFKVEADADEQIRIDTEIENLIGNFNELDSEIELDLDTINQITDLENQRFLDTGLTGQFLDKAQLQYIQGGVHNGGGFQTAPIISLSFDREGAVLFEDITRNNIGKSLAIYLDGSIISAPMINVAISGGQAIIQGVFTPDEAKTLVGRLNSGALPTPIELVSTSTVGPSLGQEAVEAGLRAGVIGLILVASILVLWYRLPGLVAVVALALYTVLMLWVFKMIPVTLTSAGIAGFIISIGIAVDANILIFERVREELSRGELIYSAVEIGFKRAWVSIRDANISSIISAIFLFAIGTTLMKGFALTFGLGVLVSMLTAVTLTRYLLLALSSRKDRDSKWLRFLYQSGFHKK